jgi:hypothetical protein
VSVGSRVIGAGHLCLSIVHPAFLVAIFLPCPLANAMGTKVHGAMTPQGLPPRGGQMNAEPNSPDERGVLALIEAKSWARPSAISPLDVVVYAVIIGIGLLEVFLSQTSDFWFDDVSFLERGLSLLHTHFYGISGIPERTQPPGFPFLCAVISAIFGATHAILLHAMAVIGALGSLLTYEYLRREENRKLAAAVCLLLASSTHYFIMATRTIWPVYPYTLTAVGVLIAVRKADTAANPRTRTVWSLFAALLLGAALTIHSTGIALLGGLLAWTGSPFLINRRTALQRLKTLLAVLVVGCAMQGWWMHLGSPLTGWPLPGYPASYLSQLKLKNGNFPEMGTASAGDLVARAGRNLYDRARYLTELVEHQGVVASWSSPALMGMIILVVLGLGDALWRTGGRVMEWYFLCLEGMYLFWPWSIETRFVMPSAPFALVYGWRGVQMIQRLATRTPILTGVAGLLFVSMGLGIPASLWALGAWHPSALPGGLQAGLSALAWLAIATASALLLWKERRSIFPGGLFSSTGKQGRHLWAIAVSLLVLLGIGKEIMLGRENLHFVVDDDTFPEVAGAKWIGAHTPPDAVVLARHDTIVHYYAQRKVLWFPPLSKPTPLFEGIAQRKVNYVLVVKHEWSYYLPDDPDCFAPLLTAYPGAFRLAASGHSYSVYEVLQ